MKLDVHTVVLSLWSGGTAAAFAVMEAVSSSGLSLFQDVTSLVPLDYYIPEAPVVFVLGVLCIELFLNEASALWKKLLYVGVYTVAWSVAVFVVVLSLHLAAGGTL
jgi:hypothetical protein